MKLAKKEPLFLFSSIKTELQNTKGNTSHRLMPYPCSLFYADIKSDIRFDNKLWNSFNVKRYHKFYIIW